MVHARAHTTPTAPAGEERGEAGEAAEAAPQKPPSMTRYHPAREIVMGLALSKMIVLSQSNSLTVSTCNTNRERKGERHHTAKTLALSVMKA